MCSFYFNIDQIIDEVAMANNEYIDPPTYHDVKDIASVVLQWEKQKVVAYRKLLMIDINGKEMPLAD